MIRIAVLALLAGGTLLLGFGAYAMDGVAYDVSRFFSAEPTNRAVGILVVGILMLVAGVAGLLPIFRKT